MSPKLLNIVLVLIPAILYNFVYLPLTTGVDSVVMSPKASIRTLQDTNVQYANTLSLLGKIQTDIKKINDDYKSLDPATTSKVLIMLPDSIDTLKLRREVIAIADSAGIAIKEVSVKEDKGNSATLGAYIVEFSVKARYKNVKLLLEEYEKNLRLYTIESLRIARQDTKTLKAEELQNLDRESLMVTIAYKVNYLK
jgi:hypothetical protein